MIPHSRPTIGEEEVEAVSRVLRSGYIAQGEIVSQFEDKMRASIGTKYAVATSSGSAALHLALQAMGVRGGDQVATSAYVCSAVLNCIKLIGAEPLLVDISPDTYNIDAKKLKESATGRTKAVIVPHMFGLPADLEEIIALGIPVIEDCALSLGATYQGKPMGSMGTVSIFSFYATKVIATGEGGMILTNSAELMEKVRDWREYDQKPDYLVRYNYKLTDMEAALGIVQLEKLPLFIEKRQDIASRYFQELSQMNLTLPVILPDRQHIFYRYVVRSSLNAEEFIQHLKELGIEAAKPVYQPLSLYLNLSGFPDTIEAWQKGVSIPIYPSLTEDELTRVVEGVRRSLSDVSL